MALRFAAHILRNPEPGPVPEPPELPALEDAVQARITAGAHPNLLHLARPWDQKAKRFKTRLSVDEIRQTVEFFGTARAETGWRVAIVDSVDDMNAQSANALLKILEEPPDRTLFVLIAHSQATILPTIRSRCVPMPLKTLSGSQLLNVLECFEIDAGSSSADTDLLVELSAGSVRKAIVLLKEDGISLYRDFSEIVGGLDNPDWALIHKMGERVSGRGSEDRYNLLLDFAFAYMETRAKGKIDPAASTAGLARWAELWEKTRNSVRLSNAYNLDRKQVILNLFHNMGEAAGA